MISRGHPFRASQAVAAAFAIAISLGAPLIVQAAPITIDAANVWRADRMPNPIGFLPTALVPWVSATTDPGGNVNLTQLTATIEGTTYNLQRIPTGILAGIYFAQLPYDDSLTGNWTITATNDGDTTTTTRPGFLPVDAMPFVSNIGFTGTGTDITVHWTVTPGGEARLDEQQVGIWDLSNPLSPFIVQFFGIGAAPRSIDLSTLPLNEGTPYAVEINNVDRNAATGYIDAFSGNWLTGWTPTAGEVQLPPSVPEPASFALLVTGLTGLGWLRRRRRVLES